MDINQQIHLFCLVVVGGCVFVWFIAGIVWIYFMIWQMREEGDKRDEE